ncbi:hypothetical protein FACS1894192_03600 [Bacilli bacterium]|nr:hypothetical protein FACS1894192_03600 [Bacilli bacterium]
MRKKLKGLLLALVVFVSATTQQVFAETYGSFQVEKTAPTPEPLPTGSGVVPSSQLPMTGEQAFTWALFVGLLLIAFVLILLFRRRRKEEMEEEASHA